MGGLVIGVIANPFEPGEFIELGWLTYPVTIIYLVAYVNIINLIDGLDGLAAGISCIASVAMFVLSIWAGRLDAAALACAIAGSTLGFLQYNFHPASIFMGDSGSLTLGFALGTISLLSVTRIAGLTTIIVPLVIAGIPIIDTFSAIVRRTRAHVSVGRADRGHIHHRLLAEGFDQKQAVLVVYAWTALLCAGALVMTQVTTVPRICIFLVLLVASGAFANHLHLFEPVLRHHRDPHTGDDELVGPDDPAFAEETEKARERREEKARGASRHSPGGQGLRREARLNSGGIYLPGNGIPLPGKLIPCCDENGGTGRIRCRQRKSYKPNRYALLSVSECLLGNVGKVGEGLLVAVGNLGEDLAVKLNAGKLEAVHEGAVGEVVHAGSSVDALNPQAAEVALLVATVTVLVLAGVLGLLLHATEGAGGSSVIALGTLDQGLTLLAAGDCALNSRHI